jgi:hypothetical protein
MSAPSLKRRVKFCQPFCLQFLVMLILISTDVCDFIFPFRLKILVSIEKIYKTRKTVFGHNSKHREVVISTLVSVFGNVVKTRSFVFHILLETPALCQLITILSSLTIKHFNNDTQFKNAWLLWISWMWFINNIKHGSLSLHLNNFLLKVLISCFTEDFNKFFQM